MLIAAADIQSLVDQTDNARGDRGLPQFPWASPALNPGDVITARQFTDLNAGIADLWYSKALGSPTWTDQTPGGPSVGTPATIIRASHIANAENWLTTFVGADPPLPRLGMGVDSKSYDPNAAQFPTIIDFNWATNVYNTGSPLSGRVVRCKVIPTVRDDGSFPATDLSNCKMALGLYTGLQLQVFITFTKQLSDPLNLRDRSMDALDSDYTNPFISQWANAASTIASSLHQDDAALSDFIIWNEPNNVSPEQLDPDHFAALLYQCYQLKPAGVRYWWGGIFTDPASAFPDTGALGYIQSVYESLVSHQKASAPGGPWPWDGINVHFHRDRLDSHMNGFFASLSQKRSSESFGDQSMILSGEWGVTREDVSSNASSLGHLYSVIAPNVDYMIFFGHPLQVESIGTWGLYDYDQTRHDGEVIGTYVQGAADQRLVSAFESAPVPASPR